MATKSLTACGARANGTHFSSISTERSSAPPLIAPVLREKPSKKSRPGSARPKLVSPTTSKASDISSEDSDFTPQIFSLTHLPPSAIVQKVLDAFYSSSATLFFICPRDYAFDLFHSLYHGIQYSNSLRLDAALGELCAILAVGGQYDHDNVSAEHRRAFFATARENVSIVMKMSELRAMRVHILLSMFSMMEKRTAAWSYIAAGLRIAQTYGLHKKDYPELGGFNKEEWKRWRKNWRTLKFFESWLAGTLGRLPDAERNANLEDFRALTVGDSLSSHDKSIPGVDIGVDVETVQTELGKVGFLMASILKNVYRTERCSIRSIDDQMSQLEDWHLALPQYMRLETLASEVPDIRARRAIMLVHLMYLGSIILLTRKLVIQLVSRPADAPWMHDGSKEEARRYMEMCFGAAMHTAMLVGILLDEGAVFKRCWLIINHSWNSLVLLLFHVVQKKRHGRPESEHIEYLRNASKLLRLLLYCAPADNVAFLYLQTIEQYSFLFEQLIPVDPSIQETLRQTQHIVNQGGHSSGNSTESEMSLPSSPNSDHSARGGSGILSLDVVAQDLFEILRSPFGGEEKVETGPQLSQLPEQEETCYYRFWSGGWKSQFKLAEWEQKKLPLKRLYSVAEDEDDYYDEDDEDDEVNGLCGVGPPRYAKRWKGIGISGWDGYRSLRV